MGQTVLNSLRFRSPSSSQIAIAAINSSTGTYNVYTMSSSGANVTNVTPNAYMSGNVYPTSWSPDGSSIACQYTASGSSTFSVMLLKLNGGFSPGLTPSGFKVMSTQHSPQMGRKLRSIERTQVAPRQASTSAIPR